MFILVFIIIVFVLYAITQPLWLSRVKYHYSRVCTLSLPLLSWVKGNAILLIENINTFLHGWMDGWSYIGCCCYCCSCCFVVTSWCSVMIFLLLLLLLLCHMFLALKQIKYSSFFSQIKHFTLLHFVNMGFVCHSGFVVVVFSYWNLFSFANS